jgi:hypothetical protein
MEKITELSHINPNGSVVAASKQKWARIAFQQDRITGVIDETLQQGAFKVITSIFVKNSQAGLLVESYQEQAYTEAA